MARILFFAVLAMCLVAMIQCGPVASPEATTVNPLAEIEAAVKTAFGAVQKGFEDIANDPTVKKMLEDGARFVIQSTDTIRQGAEKMIPATKE